MLLGQLRFGGLMQGKSKERWMELCEQAADEQDSGRLHKLFQEISRLLEEKKNRVNGTESKS